MHRLLLLRHGETEWSRSHRHTGRTDLPLTALGEDQARAVGRAIAGRAFALVLTSPLRRAAHSAELAGLAAVPEPDLVEWDYGAYEGRLTREIEAERTGWNIWLDGVPQGESPADVAARADRVLARVRPALEEGDVCLVGHAHMLRMVTARYLGLPSTGGALMRLGTGTLSELGQEHGRPVLLLWNAPAAAVQQTVTAPAF